MNSTTICSWSDEWQKIAAERSRKEDMKRFLKAMAMVGGGTLVGAAAGGLVSGALKKQIMASSPESKIRFLQRSPYILGALGGAASLGAHFRHQKLRKYVEQSE